MRSDTDIVKGLNLNKDPKGVPNGSLIFAKNIKLDDDGMNITNEEGFIEALGFDINGEELKGKIVGTITCNKEIVLFTYDYNTKQSFIYRAQEVDGTDKLNLVPVQTAWKYTGGTIHGTYSYNINGELIINIAAYSKNGNVPLKSINLDKPGNNESLYLINPNIPIANMYLSNYIRGISIPNGIYFFFIRYEIEDNYYTKWFPIGIPQFAINRKRITLSTELTYTDWGNVGSFSNTKYKSVKLNTNEDVSHGFNLHINIQNTYNYKSFQLGYILQHEEATLCRSWRKYNITDTDYDVTFDAKDFEDYPIEKMTDNVIGLYNVKCLTNYENRCYVADYKESEYNVNLQSYADKCKVRLVAKYVSSNNETNTSSETQNKYKKWTLNFKGQSNQGSVSIVLRSDENTVKISSLPSLLSFFVLDRIKPEYGESFTAKFCTDENKQKGYWRKTDNTEIKVDDSYLKLYDDGHIEIIDSVGNRLSSKTDTYKSVIFYIYGGIAYGSFKADINGYEMESFTATVEDTTETPNTSGDSYTPVSSIDNVILKTLMPDSVYDFYIHYVRQDGTYTNGLRLANDNDGNVNGTVVNLGSTTSIKTKIKDVTALKINNIDCSSILSFPELANVYLYEIVSNTPNITQDYYGQFGYYENADGAKLFRTPCGINNSLKQFRFGISVENITIPDGYVGYFISYAEPEILNNYQAIYCEKSANVFKALDVETGKCNYAGTIFKSLYNYSNNKYTNKYSLKYIEDSSVIASNVGGDYKPYEISRSTLGTNGGIALSLKTEYSNNIYSAYIPDDGDVGNVLVLNRNIYTSKIKNLISLGVVCYNSSTYSDSRGTSLTNDVQNKTNKFSNYDYNYPAYFGMTDNIILKNRIFVNDTGKVYSTSIDGLVDTEHETGYSMTDVNLEKFSRINLKAVTIKKSPEYIASVLGNPDGSNHKLGLQYLVKPINLTDLFEFKNSYIEDIHKVYTNYNKDVNYKDIKSYTIRRSNIISDESLYNNWREFESDAYKVINVSKGKINNLFGVSNNLYIHTENTILCINKDNTLKAENTEVQLATRDLFEGEPVEVLIGNHGFGGLQTQDSWCFNHLGYFFIDRDSKRIYLFNDNHLTDLSTDIIALLNNITIDNGWLETDFVNDRVIVCIQYHTDKVAKDYITLSYSLKSKKWLSLHDYYFSRCLNTKNRCYFWGNDYEVANQLFCLSKSADLGCYSLLTNNSFLFPESHIIDDKKVRQSAIFDIIFNENYLASKSIDSINYIINKVFDYADSLITRMAEPSMENNTFGDKNHYAGDLLRIYTDSNDTGNIDISINDEVNQYNDYKKPHYDNGYWQFNYFRNALIVAATEKQLLRRLGVKDKSQLSAEQQAKFDENLKNYVPSDNRNLIYGRYFVVRFIFDNTDNIPFRFETLSINYNAY